MANRSPFAQEPIVVPLAGESVSVPHRNAAEWVTAAYQRNGPGGMLLELCRETTRSILRDELISGSVTVEQIADASHTLMQEAIPYRWWESTRLLLVSGDPSVLGRTVVAGMDPWELTAAQWCAGIYTICTEHADDKGRLKFDAMLSQAPAGYEDDSWGEESFTAMINEARRMPGMG